MPSNPFLDSRDSVTGGDIKEPVLESAPLARWIAERLCQVDPRTSETCAWYHGFRQYLRALGLAITPADHADFLREAFAASAKPGARLRILVSGAIDYSMFAHVLWATHSCSAAPEVTVVDVCDTPLFLNLWYAQRVGAPVRTARCSILEYEDANRYDYICTNAFFGQFSPDERTRLLQRWHTLLLPGGRVLTVSPVRPDSSVEPVGFSPQEAASLREAVRQRAQRHPEQFDLTPDELAHRADVFASRMRVHPVRSTHEIRTLFENAGFRLEHLSCDPLPGKGSAGLTGPTVSRTAKYALVVARRD